MPDMGGRGRYKELSKEGEDVDVVIGGPDESMGIGNDSGKPEGKDSCSLMSFLQSKLNISH